MNPTPADDSPLTRLEQALVSGGLPGHARKAGQRLLDRLKSPVSCVILGPQDSGKSTLLNFLAGKAVVPKDACFPILELAWGDSTRTIFTSKDGATTVLEGVAPDAPSGEVPASVKIETDLPILKRLSLFEVNLSGPATRQSTAFDWAIGQADMVLWCTQEFLPEEQNLWAGAPDALKDHGFLVLAKADLLVAQGILTQRIASVQDVAADEFHSVFPIATFQAIDAAKQDTQVGVSALKASGGSALLAAVLRLAGQGRGADMDSALAFLSRHGRKTPPKQDGATKIQHADLAAVTTQQEAGKGVEGAAISAADLATTALEYLNCRASELRGISADPSHPDPSVILNYCGETANGLADLVAEQDIADPALVELQEDLLDAAELLLLMETESGINPAADAVTLLLQVRRGLEYRLAA